MSNNVKFNNILHIIYDDCDNPWLGGGGARRTYEIYKRFPDSTNITILTGYYSGAKRIETIGKITYVRLGLPFNYLISRITFSLAAMVKLRQLKYDVVVDDYTAFSPCFSFWLAKSPVIGSFQNLHSQKAAKGKGLIKGLSARFFDFFALRYFKNFTAVSPFLTEQILKRAKYRHNVRFIGIGIDQVLFNIGNRLNEDDPYILYIGRLEIFQKGIDVLLQAYMKLKTKPILLLAGTGADEAKIKEMVKSLGIESTVRFAGRFSNEEKLEILRKALFVVMPSRFEGLPVVPLEAMAAGRAFIGTNIHGTRDICNGKALLAEPGNSDELAELMSSIINDSTLRDKLESQGREYSRSYQWSAIAEQFHDFIRDSINNTFIESNNNLLKS
ncbi:MAG: glycosyltransferase family 4 protein [Fibrobacteres bacterium]|nr:glycosyltransferase family 4 protein [Fibrobacterota bacterium]